MSRDAGFPIADSSHVPHDNWVLLNKPGKSAVKTAFMLSCAALSLMSTLRANQGVTLNVSMELSLF
jgi:hypothetical protein